MWPEPANTKDCASLQAELLATTDRLKRRTRRLRGRTDELRQSVQRLRASTERLRDRLESSFPPPPLGSAAAAGEADPSDR